MARIDAPIVIHGERGVGKSTLAKFIHSQSSRSEGPFIEVNCSTIPEAVFEIAFTGQADANSPGYISLASGGTLVLKEIDQITPAAQCILFKHLQLQQTCRVIALSELCLEDAVKSGSFREDLFYYLHLASIHLKPLRERPADLELAIGQFTQQLNIKYKEQKKVADDLYLHLLQLKWSGNFRELQNVLERSFIESETNVIGLSDLPISYQPEDDEQIGFEIEGQTLPHILEFVEKKVLLNAQKRYKTTTEMALVLGISQPSVVRKLKKYVNKSGRDDIE